MLRISLLLSVLAVFGCSRATEEPLPGFRPDAGRLVGVAWSQDRFPTELRARIADLRRDAIQVFETSREQRTIGPLRADAIVALLGQKVDRAVALLSRATELAPGNAIVWSDLAAARLQRSTVRSDPYDLVLALAAARRAVQLHPGLVEARFNKALALGRLSLRARAEEEWQLYRRDERDPLWSREAQSHAKELAQSASVPAWDLRLTTVERAVERGDWRKVWEVVARSPQDFREHVEEKRLADWAKAEVDHREPESRSHLALSRAIGKSLAESNGERMLADTISQIDRLHDRAPEELLRLAKGFRAYGEGLSLLKQGAVARALLSLRKAQGLLIGQKSPFAGWATYQLALCHYQHSEYDQVRLLLVPLARSLEPQRYKALHGRVFWLLGLVELIEGDPTASLTAFESALADFQELEESANAARVNALVASGLDYLGQEVEAWRRLYPALIEPTTLDKPADRSLICLIASWLAMKQGEAEIALWFQDEVLRSTRTGGRAYAMVGALRWHGAILAALGRKREAANDLREARRYLNLVADSQMHQSLEGDLRLAEAELARGVSPNQEIALLDDAVRIFRATSYHYRLRQALYERALAENSLGRSDEAERDLIAAIAESELQREKILSPEDRISYFDRTREIFDTMIWFQLMRRQRSEAAFRYSEQAKARVLQDWLLLHPVGDPLPSRTEGIGQGSLDVASLQKDLPQGTIVVEYAVLPQHLVIWVLRRTDFQVETVSIRAKDLNDLVRGLIRALKEDRKADFLKTSSRLHEVLVRPVARHLRPGDRIVAIPDGALHTLSFALLRDDRTGRYLFQDHVLSVAPSARILVTSLQRDESLARRRGPRALVVVDPAFDQTLYSLPRLKGAKAEAVIARIFPESKVLGDREATRSAFLHLAGDFEIVHFGGHSLVNTELPLLSQMLFAGSPGDPARGVLYSGDILKQRFENTRLAVLASCSTAAGRISRTEGVENLARPFLAAGVPAVIASLWDVDDQVTADFFTRFYRHLRQGFDVAGALRATQIESIERGSGHAADPLAWGAFEVIGANSPIRIATSRP